MERSGTGLLIGFIGADGWLVHSVINDVRELDVVLNGIACGSEFNSFWLFVAHLDSPPFFAGSIALIG
jgi:hypothetical protein